MIISTMKEMDTNTTEVRLTYFCRLRVPTVMCIITVIFRSNRLTISFPFGSGIIIATTSSIPIRKERIINRKILQVISKTILFSSRVISSVEKKIQKTIQSRSHQLLTSFPFLFPKDVRSKYKTIPHNFLIFCGF